MYIYICMYVHIYIYVYTYYVCIYIWGCKQIALKQLQGLSEWIKPCIQIRSSVRIRQSMNPLDISGRPHMLSHVLVSSDAFMWFSTYLRPCQIQHQMFCTQEESVQDMTFSCRWQVSVDSWFLVTDLTENAELIGGLKSQVFCLQYPFAGFNSSQQHVIAYPHLQNTNCWKIRYIGELTLMYLVVPCPEILGHIHEK